MVQIHLCCYYFLVAAEGSPKKVMVMVKRRGKRTLGVKCLGSTIPKKQKSRKAGKKKEKKKTPKKKTKWTEVDNADRHRVNKS